jgi:hypothetical protein
MPPAVEFVQADATAPAWRRFVPKRRVSVDEIEAVSVLAPPRHIRVRADLHAPVRVSVNLGAGVSRVHPGQEIILPARAAHVLVKSGAATYIDDEPTVPAA